MSSYAIAYWLMPAGAAREFFDGIISELAMRFDAPVFEPHLTLFVAPEGSRAPRKVLREVPSPDLLLVVREIGWSENFTKTLFVRFDPNQMLLDLVEAIRKSSGSEECEIDPHLSLVYKRLPPKTKCVLAKQVQLPFAEVRFQGIRAVRCKLHTNTADNVREWKLLVTQNSTIRNGA
jgi:hypothetical protein